LKKRSLLINTILSTALFCSGVTFAQEPVQDIDQKKHPVLAAAQNHIIQANRDILESQKDNKEDMQGHAEKARQLLVQANQELKLAAEAANAAASQKKK
jgi:hypothetical protein